MLDPFDLWRRLSLDRKLDIIGIFLALVGLVTLLSLVSVNRSSLTSAWIGLLDRAFGWGTYLLPGALLLVGLWLILRNFERIPWPSVERIFGALLLFLNILGWMHFALNPGAQADAFIQGLQAGAKPRPAICAGVSLEVQARSCPELRLAIDTFGGGS